MDPGPVRPRQVFLHVTKACTLRCSYCYFSARDPMPGEMTREEYARLWPQLVELGHGKAVFTGGEPLLRRDLFDLLRDLRDADPGHSILRCLNTNGQLVTAASARTLVGLADEVRVSLDALRERNDALRGPGSFDAAVSALDRLAAEGFEPKVLVTLTRPVLPDLDDLVAFLAGRGIRRIKINLLKETGRAAGRPDWIVGVQEARAAAAHAWARLGRSPAPGGTEEEEPSSCGVGRFLNVMPDGGVHPCHVLGGPEFRLGNVRTATLASMVSRTGPLGRLADLDFRALAREEPDVASALRARPCLGEAMAAEPGLPGWSRVRFPEMLRMPVE